MSDHPNGFLAAAQFLTRVPIRLHSAPDLGRSVPWFPVVGAMIGAATGATVAGLAELVPGTVAATIGVLVGIVVTGAFHEDGLADTADAMGGTSPVQRREILHDSRHGSYGVAAMVGTIVLRVACVATLAPAWAFAGLVAAHTLGRGSALAVMGVAPAVREDGLGADYARSLSRPSLVLGVLAAIAIGAAATGWWVGPLVAGAAVGAAVVSVVAVRAFGGVTGDVLGAVEQVGECVVLVVVTGIAARHQLWWR